MHGLKRDLWKAGIAIAGMLLFLLLIVWIPGAAAGAEVRASGLAAMVTVQATPSVDATVTVLNKEKLQHENDWWWNYGATILTSLISTLTLAAAGVFTVVRYFNDRRDTREKQEAEAKRLAVDRRAERERRDEEQQRWLEDRQAERERRDEERFQSVVAGLGSNNIEARAGAAIMLRTFLQPGYEQFYQQSFDLAVTHLRLRHINPNTPEPIDSLSQALATVLKESFPLVRNNLDQVESRFDTQSCDASRIRLDGTFLIWGDLKYIWMAEASLIAANLFRTDFSEAQLTRANFNGANLNYVNLSKAQLIRANLSGVQLKGANLRGANPEDAAYLETTNLRGVKGLTKAQLEACKAKGAIIDEDLTTSSPQPTVATSLSSQSNDVQSQPAPAAQESTPTPETGESSAPSSKPGPQS